MRARALHPPGGRRSPSRWLSALTGASAVGSLSGLLAGPLLSPWAPASPLDEAHWSVVQPGGEEGVITPGSGRGVRQERGELIIVPHAFGRGARVALRAEAPIERVELVISEGSSALLIDMPPPQRRGTVPRLEVDAHHYQTRPTAVEAVLSADRQLVLVNDKGTWWAETGGTRKVVAQAEAGGFEFTAETGTGRVDAISAWDARGQPVVTTDFRTTDLPAPTARALALLGAIAGAFAWSGFGPREVAASLFRLIIPFVWTLLLFSRPTESWTTLIERFALVHLGPESLRMLLLPLGLLPLLPGCLARLSGVIPAEAPPSAPEANNPPPWRTLAGGLLTASLIAAWTSGLQPTTFLFHGLLSASFIGAPLYFAQASGWTLRTVIQRDLPALFLAPFLGWGPALVVGGVWRLALGAAWAPTLFHRAPRAGTIWVLWSLALMPLGVELSLRQSPLDRAWSAEHLAETPSGLGADSPWLLPFWKSACGVLPRTIWWLGGSSTGGAYQLSAQPEAFAAGQVQGQLCSEGIEVSTINYGGGGRDTWTFSRGIDTLLRRGRPDLVVVYVGVNDVLSEGQTFTRKERESAGIERGAFGQGLLSIATHSRLFTGISLGVRKIPVEGEGAKVAVPVADAEENFARLAGALGPKVPVLLVPEVVKDRLTNQLKPYREMQAKFAAQTPNWRYLDPTIGQPGDQIDAMLVDSNHLSVQGHRWLAEQLLPELRPVLSPTPD
jgi:lysophospholipase L1-like esterase